MLLLAAAGVAVHGYHFGVQDGACYVPALKQALDPSLYPFGDSAFFPAVTHFSLFVPLVRLRARDADVAGMGFAWVARAQHLRAAAGVQEIGASVLQ